MNHKAYWSDSSLLQIESLPLFGIWQLIEFVRFGVRLDRLLYPGYLPPRACMHYLTGSHEDYSAECCSGIWTVHSCSTLDCLCYLVILTGLEITSSRTNNEYRECIGEWSQTKVYEFMILWNTGFGCGVGLLRSLQLEKLQPLYSRSRGP